MTDQLRLGYLFGKALRQELLTAEEIEFAEKSATLAVAQEAIEANSILSLAGSEEQRRLGLERLAVLCSRVTSLADHRAVALLMAALEHLPPQELIKNPAFAALAHESATHRFLPARLNSMRALRQLAAGGDGKAAELLHKALHDEHPYVRRTAFASLRIAGFNPALPEE